MKKHHFTTLILTIPLLTATVACSEAQLAQKAAVDVKSAAAPKPETAAAAKPAAGKPAAANQKPGKPGEKAGQDQESDELKPLTVPVGFKYQAEGRRDPFVNPVPKPVAELAPDNKPLIRPDGLPGVLVSEVRLTGIVRAADVAMTKAILSVGRKTYFARQGDPLFDGVIKEIRLNEVVFMMVSTSTRKPVNRELTVSTGKTSAALAGEKK
jgi:Tfp pilus assembly protein PilP